VHRIQFEVWLLTEIIQNVSIFTNIFTNCSYNPQMKSFRRHCKMCCLQFCAFLSAITEFAQEIKVKVGGIFYNRKHMRTRTCCKLNWTQKFVAVKFLHYWQSTPAATPAALLWQDCECVCVSKWFFLWVCESCRCDFSSRFSFCFFCSQSGLSKLFDLLLKTYKAIKCSVLFLFYFENYKLL